LAASASRPVSLATRQGDATRVDDPTQLTDMVCEAAAETKAQDITVLDVRGQTIVTDFFVLCTGTSTTHIQAIAQNVLGHLRMDARRRAKPEGDSESLWIVLDYSDVILHVFDAETRDFYDLERLWGDAKIAKYTAPETNPAVEARAPEAAEL
jgi:ribosome-associated protein